VNILQDNILGSEIVETVAKRQYHIALEPGEVAERILLVGDPERVEKFRKILDPGILKVERANREFKTITGTFKAIPVTVMSTGIGPSNIEIAMIELSRIVSPKVVLRVGSCGGLQKDTNLGDLVISTGAVRLEDTSLRFVDQSYPSVAHYEVILALVEAANKLRERYHVGLTASASGFYGAQGREVPLFPIVDAQLPDNLAKRNVLNFEMESSTLFTLGEVAGWRTGTICTVFANRPRKEFIPASEKSLAEERAIRVALEACVVLEKMDSKKSSVQSSHYYPSLGL